MKKIPVIIDCDPGLDDALMLMLAFGSGKFDIKAITTSAGNQTQEKTLLNTLKIMTLIGTRVPVYKGCEKPLFRKLIIPDHLPDETGLNGPDLPNPGFQHESISAVEGIAEILMKSEQKITLVPTGPLTNIATLILAHPSLKNKIDRISLMGGGIWRGNMTPLAEFNIYVDPEAASIVFKSEIPITMCGLDVTHKAVVFDTDIQLLRAIGNIAGKTAADLMDYIQFVYPNNSQELHRGTALHDPCAIAWLLDPSRFTSKACFVDVETSGKLTTGATLVDFYDVLHQPPNADVVYDIDRDWYIETLCSAIANLP